MQLKDALPTALADLLEPPMKPTPTNTANVDWRGFVADSPKVREMLTAAQSFADEIASNMPPRWLTLTAGSGAGKTHLARCVTRWARAKGCYYTDEASGARVARYAAFVGWRQAAASLRDGAWRIMEDYAGHWFLALDDIGAEHQGGTGAVKSALERLIDDRLGKWTIITSNFSPREIAVQLDPRITSRMIRGGNVVIEAPDVRDYNLRRKP